MTTDPYKILGVNKDAADDEIKKAYRKLASANHPDKGGDTARFQEIQKAYETLSDPIKRQQQDNPFHSHFDQGSGFEFHFNTGGNPQDIFTQFFNQGFGGNPFGQPHGRQTRRNKDLRVNISVNLADTLNEQKKTISVQTTKGDRVNVDVTIPRGAAHGTTIKYAQMGDNMFETLTRGDLYVIVNILPHEQFEVYGNDLVMSVDIDSIQAMTGTDKELRGIDNREFLIKIPAGCQYGTKFRLAGQGLYKINSHNRGDLIVNVNITTPILSEEQLAILRNLITPQ